MKERLIRRGITIQSIKDLQFRGRNVEVIFGVDLENKFSYLVAVWRTALKGIILECTASTPDFSKVEPQFMASVRTVVILKEE